MILLKKSCKAALLKKNERNDHLKFSITAILSEAKVFAFSSYSDYYCNILRERAFRFACDSV
jgi:hypothetical protein